MKHDGLIRQALAPRRRGVGRDRVAAMARVVYFRKRWGG